MAKSPTHISLLALLLNSEAHREALLRVLMAAHIPKETAPEQIEETISSIFSNNISFSDDELPSERWAHSRTLHIVCKCNNFIIGRVMIDNGSALNVCPVSTLKQMNVDFNCIRPSKTTVRAFDGSRREVNGEIDLIIEARRGKHLHCLVARYGKINRGIPIHPLSYFFPGPPHIVGGTLDGSSSDSDSEPVDLPNICAVTEETIPGAYIRLAQENEELNNWTSVPRYSAELLEESRPIYFGEGLDEDGRVPEIEESLRRLKNRQVTSVEPTEEINVGTEKEPHILKIGTDLNPTQRARIIEFLTNYQEVFAWSYTDMPGLDSSIVKHFLSLDT
ncbi:hypothetical protein CRG98_021586 [Punica granatum]|uniref:Uncharacterized protein n=1 Tax=Punica granatum TaxID=22663 RepID=A0A2I0JR92_PUNGR|nr:hypothetical protein CRG98_021586 [Punica granatum]